MNRTYLSVFAMVAVALAWAPDATWAQEESRTVADGGVHVAGWMGQIDASEASRGQTLDNARLTSDGDVLHVTTGPAVAYWNPANTATGDYTVSATFNEPKYMNLNNHPHPYGLFIAGDDMGSGGQSYLYCAAYGNGNFIVRGFGPEPFQMNGRRGESNDAVHKAAGEGQPVSQELSMSVRGGKVECSINGTVVASYDGSEVVMDGRLESTDGVFGIRFGHNTEGTVTGLKVTQH